MKKEKTIIAEPQVEKTGTQSNPANKLKKSKSSTVASLDNIITSAVGQVKTKSGSGLSDEGTVASYEEKR